MHPIERLRHLARSEGVDQTLLVREAAGALAQLAGDPGELVTACRRIVALQPQAATLWWLGARVLTASDPSGEVWRAADEIVADRTDRELAHALPDDAVVASVGLGEAVRRAALRRGDVQVLHVAGAEVGLRSLLDDGLGSADDAATLVPVPPAGVGAATALADVVLLEAVAAGPDRALVAVGGLAAAAVARLRDVPVWLVAPLGRVLPAPLWDGVVARLGDESAWERGTELVGAELFDRVVRPSGLRPVAEALTAADCAPVPDLLVPGDVA